MGIITGKQLELKNILHAYQLDGKGGVSSVNDDSVAQAKQPFWLHISADDQIGSEWLDTTPLVPESMRELISVEGSRPRVTRLCDAALITLRSINFNSEDLPDPLVSIRIYITDTLIISKRFQLIESIDEVNGELLKGNGAISSGDWLVRLADALTDHSNEFIDNLHDKIIEIEDGVLAQQIPERGEMALIRKQLIMLRRYLSPQRDVFSRLASERFSWMSNEDRHRMQDIADRLGRALDDIDASVSRTTVLSDEIKTLMAEATNRRSYTMSMLAMLFLPASFLTGLFGVNLAGIPGSQSPKSFIIFSLVLLALAVGIIWWLRRSRWL